MELALAESHEMLREVTRRFVENRNLLRRGRGLITSGQGFDRDIWDQGARSGWSSMLASGLGNGPEIAALAVVIEELGRSLFPTPAIATNLVSYLIATEGSAVVRSSFLEGLESVVLVGTLQWLPDLSGRAFRDLRIERTSKGLRLSGSIGAVPDAQISDVVVVAGQGLEGVTYLVLSTATPGISVGPMESLDLTRRFGELVFDDVIVEESAALGAIGQGEESMHRQESMATVLLCADTIGATEAAFEMTVDYVRSRKAFGRAIGSFQALKHRLADMFLWLEGAKSATTGAASALEQQIDVEELSSVAAAYVGEKAPLILRECVQMHGGIGFTWEHDLHLYLRRVESNVAMMGGVGSHQDRIASALGV